MRFCCAMVILAVVVGCGGPRTCQVEGTVAVKGQSGPAKELAGYQVIFESHEPRTSASGVVQADGTFRVSTYREGDGAVPGKHRVCLVPPLEEEGKPRVKKILPPKYQKFETSGWEFEIKPPSTAVRLEVDAIKR